MVDRSPNITSLPCCTISAKTSRGFPGIHQSNSYHYFILSGWFIKTIDYRCLWGPSKNGRTYDSLAVKNITEMLSPSGLNFVWLLQKLHWQSLLEMLERQKMVGIINDTKTCQLMSKSHGLFHATTWPWQLQLYTLWNLSQAYPIQFPTYWTQKQLDNCHYLSIQQHFFFWVHSLETSSDVFFFLKN